MRRAAACLVALTVVTGACSSTKNHPPDANGNAPPIRGPTAAPDLDAVHVKLTAIAEGLDQPLALAVRTGDPALYVAEQTGRVVAIVHGAVQSQPVLDIT